jgi:hypothetical protein
VSRTIFLAAAVVGFVAFLAMFVVTLAWMFVPVRIIYRDSSPVPTAEYSVRVVQHSQSFYLTPRQNALVNTIRYATPRIWFGSLAVIILAILTGAAARISSPPTTARTL